MDWPVRYGHQALVWHASTPVKPHACAAATFATALAPGIVHNQLPRAVAPPCAECSTRPGAYAMMRSRRRTQGESQGGRRRGGLCRGRGSGDGPAAPHEDYAVRTCDAALALVGCSADHGGPLSGGAPDERRQDMDASSSLFDLTDKVALVTGAGGGLGRVFARALAAHGAEAIVADIDLTSAEETCGLIAHAGGCAVPVQVDVADPTSVERMVAAYRRVDVLINNAGIAALPRR